MWDKFAAMLLLALVTSCGSEADNGHSESEAELEDTVSNNEITAEDLIEEGPNEFEWIENVATYEGKDPDSDISLALMIAGVRDTLDLFTIWTFPGEVSDKTKNMIGYPESIVASKSNYYSDDFIAIQEVSEEKYNILLGKPYNDTINIEEPIGLIELKNGMINYSIDFGEHDGEFHAFGETSPWPNFDE